MPLKKPVKAKLSIPGSKSVINRAFICAALAEGESKIENLNLCEDVLVIIESLQRLGLDVQVKSRAAHIVGGLNKLKAAKLDFKNAGTAARFSTALTCLIPGKSVLDGNKRMRERPIEDLLKALESLGAELKSESGYFPVSVRGGNLLARQNVILDSRVSSQYLSALLMIAPYLEGGLQILLQGELPSKPYVDMTLEVMSCFGVQIEKIVEGFSVPAAKYRARKFEAESDASSATYFHALNFLTNSKVKVTNLNKNSVHPDSKFPTLLKKLSKAKEKISFDLNGMPDAVPSLAVVAATLPIETRIENVANLRVKECDRLHALRVELGKLGAEVIETEDSLVIKGASLYGAEIETYDDHRIAMSFAILGTKVPGIKIKGPDCVKKSYPGFWEDLRKIGVEAIGHK